MQTNYKTSDKYVLMKKKNASSTTIGSRLYKTTFVRLLHEDVQSCVSGDCMFYQNFSINLACTLQNKHTLAD